MRTKTILLFFLFMGSYLFAQPQPLYLSEIKKVMSHSTDINELVEKVKSLNKGFEVTGEISEKGTKFSNGIFQFTLSATRDVVVIYEEAVNKYGIIRRPDLLTEVKSDGFKEDLGNTPSQISMSKRPWAFLQNAGKEKGKGKVRIIYNKQ